VWQTTVSARSHCHVQRWRTPFSHAGQRTGKKIVAQEKVSSSKKESACVSIVEEHVGSRARDTMKDKDTIFIDPAQRKKT
jgi:hypothetical protein